MKANQKPLKVPEPIIITNEKMAREQDYGTLFYHESQSKISKSSWAIISTNENMAREQIYTPWVHLPSLCVQESFFCVIIS